MRGSQVVVCLITAGIATQLLLPAKSLAAHGVPSEKEHASAEEEQVYEIGGDVKPPKLIHVVEPKFDAHSEAAFISGVVRIQIIVDAEGIPANPKVLAGISERQDKEAIEAVRQWRFKPASRLDKPVKVRAVVEVTFNLM